MGRMISAGWMGKERLRTEKEWGQANNVDKPKGEQFVVLVPP